MITNNAAIKERMAFLLEGVRQIDGSLTKVARASQLSPTTLSRWAGEAAYPTKENIEKLEVGLGLKPGSLSEYLCRQGKPTKEGVKPLLDAYSRNRERRREPILGGQADRGISLNGILSAISRISDPSDLLIVMERAVERLKEASARYCRRRFTRSSEPEGREIADKIAKWASQRGISPSEVARSISEMGIPLSDAEMLVSGEIDRPSSEQLAAIALVLVDENGDPITSEELLEMEECHGASH